MSVAIALGILSLTDFELYSFSFLFIPAGGLALGIIATIGYFYRIVNEGYKPSRQNYLMSLGMVLVTFLFIQYGDYRMSYVTKDHAINHQFKGDPISSYQDEDGKALTFYHYYAFKLKNSESSLLYHGREAIQADSFAGYNWFRWSLSFVGFLLGGIFPGWWLTRGITHCTACKQAYLTEYKLGDLSSGIVTEFYNVLVQEIESNNFKAFIDIVNRFDIFNNNESDIHEETYVINIAACPNCKHGFVIMKHYSRDEEDGTYRENDNKKIALSTEGSFAEQALSYVKAI